MPSDPERFSVPILSRAVDTGNARRVSRDACDTRDPARNAGFPDLARAVQGQVTEGGRMRRKGLKVAMLGALVLGSGGATGCKKLQGILKLLGGGSGTKLNASTLAGGNNPLGGLFGQGAQTPSPSAAVPAPAGSAATVNQIKQQYGLEITGACAEGQPLETFKDVIGRMKPGRFGDLQRIDMPCSPNQALKGTWSRVGRRSKITFYVQKGKSKPLTKHTASHELFHHLTLAPENRDFGNQAAGSSGNTPANCPSSYCNTNEDERIAEITSFCFDDMTGGTDMPKRSGWSCPGDLSGLVRTVM